MAEGPGSGFLYVGCKKDMRNSAGKTGQTLAAPLSHNPLRHTHTHTCTHPTRPRVSAYVLQEEKHQGCDIGWRGNAQT